MVGIGVAALVVIVAVVVIFVMIMGKINLLESGSLLELANTLYLTVMEHVLRRGELILLLGIGMKLMGQS